MEDQIEGAAELDILSITASDITGDGPASKMAAMAEEWKMVCSYILIYYISI